MIVACSWELLCKHRNDVIGCKLSELPFDFHTILQSTQPSRCFRNGCSHRSFAFQPCRHHVADRDQTFRHAPRPVRPIAAQPHLMRLKPSQLRALSTETKTIIDKAVASKAVVLFMKGTPETPQCGFSRASIQILGLQGVDPNKFSAFNVLENEELRQGMIFRFFSSMKQVLTLAAQV